MGIFSIFSKKEKSSPKKNLVWKSTPSKFKAALNLKEQNAGSVWLAWFQQSINDFNDYCSINGKSFPEIRLARNTQSFHTEGKPVFFIEHYPMASEEENFISQLNASAITFLNSLDEPLFQHFGGDNIINMMEKLGMGDDEQIEHVMISRSIKNAQEKLQQKVQHINQVNSAADWFKIHIGQ